MDYQLTLDFLPCCVTVHPMPKRRTVLFIQLPQLDNDLKWDNENVPLAAAYLQFAAEQAGENAHYEFIRLPESAHTAGNQSLLETITALSPDVVAGTIYLWNIERTLRLTRLLRNRLPGIRILLGGPEVAYSHPFLFRQSTADALVVGEGETVFPALLRAIRTGKPINYSTVASMSGTGYRWGAQPPPPVNLSHQLPPPGYDACRPDARGMAYLETSRGCPMRCTYCRYPHLRHSMSFLDPDDILARVRALRRLGAREIRFVDPTFNAHPRFGEIVRRLADLNRSHSLAFFAELNAERLTEEQADDLARARFVDVEVGMQSRDALVLKTIRRPTSLDKLETGIRLLTRRRIKVTLDVMYGLPLQDTGDVKRSVKWALKHPSTNVQCLQTLLLPGTELRDRRREWRMSALSLPPYAVTGTSTMDAGAFGSVEALIARHPKLRSDVPTTQFVGSKLDLFSARVDVAVSQQGVSPVFPANRCACLMTGSDLYGCRKTIGRFIRTAIRREPDSLFQFVLCPEHEEPLDLLDELIGVIRSQPRHLIDRYSPVALPGKIASRRVMIQLPQRKRLSRKWVAEAEDLLMDAFF